MNIHLEIVTPSGIAYQEDVDMVTVPGILGTMGILPRHTPLFSQLTEGEVKIKKNQQEIFLSIGGGFVEVSKNKVMVLVTRALHAKELNEAEIIKAQNRAREELKQKVSPQQQIQASMMLRQSLVDLRLLRRRKKTIN